MAKKVRTINVKGNSKDNRVALWEKNEAHPNGEIFVVNDGKNYQVAETAAVKRLLGEGSLVEGEAGDAPPLRKATDQEEDAAGLQTPVEKETARTPIRSAR